MNREEYESLCSQIGELDSLLAMTPEEAVIGRMSLQAHREKVAAEIAAFSVPARWPATGYLTFNGLPVQGRPGIDAGFAHKALDKFSSAVACAGASLVGPLHGKGPIPNQGDYGLLITNVATGSFGFEIMEATVPEGPDPSPTERGIEQVHSLLKAAATNDDDGAIADAHPRVLANVHGFLEVMAGSSAICSFTFNEERAEFKDEVQLQRGMKILSPANVCERERKFRGYFRGYLPNSRRVEFVNSETGEELSGWVSGAVDYPYRYIISDINELLNKPVTLHVRVRQAGNGKASYTLLGYDVQ